jgi:hypothetical protein
MHKRLSGHIYPETVLIRKLRGTHAICHAHSMFQVEDRLSGHYSEIGFCPDGRPSDRNSESLAGVGLETGLGHVPVK